jgi:hypothetical protein
MLPRFAPLGVNELQRSADGGRRITDHAKPVRNNKNDETDCTNLNHGTFCKVEKQEGGKRHKALYLSTVGYATTNSFINKIWMLQRARRNTIGRRSTSVRMTCALIKAGRHFPLWLERQSSSLLSFVRFSYQFISLVQLPAYLYSV